MGMKKTFKRIKLRYGLLIYRENNVIFDIQPRVDGTGVRLARREGNEKWQQLQNLKQKTNLPELIVYRRLETMSFLMKFLQWVWSATLSDHTLAMAWVGISLTLFDKGLDALDRKVDQWRQKRKRNLIIKLRDSLPDGEWPSFEFKPGKIWDDIEIELFTFRYYKNFVNRRGLLRNIKKLESLEQRRQKLFYNSEELLEFWRKEFTDLNPNKSLPEITLDDARELETAFLSAIAVKIFELDTLNNLGPF